MPLAPLSPLDAPPLTPGAGARLAPLQPRSPLGAAAAEKAGASEKTRRRSSSTAKVDKEACGERPARSKNMAASIKDEPQSEPLQREDAVGGAVGSTRSSSRGGTRRRHAPKAQSDAPQPGSPSSPAATPAHRGRDGDAMANQHCMISTEADPNAEIRTKVFRMGAPLLRSTIPVNLGAPRATEAQLLAAAAERQRQKDAGSGCDDDTDDSDVETVLSLSDIGLDDQGALSVTLDFPC